MNDMSLSSVSEHLRDAKRAPREAAGQAPTSRIEIVPLDPVVEPSLQTIMAHDPSDPRGEAMCALRTELLLRRESADRAEIIVLLSPCRSEGRSLLAADLAIAVARTGCSTLLVDADFRHPRQHVLFGTHNHQGLSEAITAGERPRLRTVHGHPRLSLLTAGEVAGDPLFWLSSPCFKLMVDDWRENFGFVVIDTAPVAQFSEGLVIADLVGRVLVLSRAQHTPYRQMQDMLRRLTVTRSQIQGAVISHF